MHPFVVLLGWSHYSTEHTYADKAHKEVEAQKRKDILQFQKGQIHEEDVKHNKEHAEELAYARQLDADYVKWKEEEANKMSKRLDATHKLKISFWCYQMFYFYKEENEVMIRKSSGFDVEVLNENKW